ncbi:unnamed protein product [Amoebophrya sp. A120]|nr:unnamed protein product [Amoebophrya sp. A120]|eukprot:GSA120T00015345001.1
MKVNKVSIDQRVRSLDLKSATFLRRWGPLEQILENAVKESCELFVQLVLGFCSPAGSATATKSTLGILGRIQLADAKTATFSYHIRAWQQALRTWQEQVLLLTEFTATALEVILYQEDNTDPGPPVVDITQLQQVDQHSSQEKNVAARGGGTKVWKYSAEKLARQLRTLRKESTSRTNEICTHTLAALLNEKAQQFSSSETSGKRSPGKSKENIIGTTSTTLLGINTTGRGTTSSPLKAGEERISSTTYFADGVEKEKQFQQYFLQNFLVPLWQETALRQDLVRDFDAAFAQLAAANGKGATSQLGAITRREIQRTLVIWMEKPFLQDLAGSEDQCGFAIHWHQFISSPSK